MSIVESLEDKNASSRFRSSLSNTIANTSIIQPHTITLRCIALRAHGVPRCHDTPFQWLRALLAKVVIPKVITRFQELLMYHGHVLTSHRVLFDLFHGDQSPRHVS